MVKVPFQYNEQNGQTIVRAKLIYFPSTHGDLVLL